MKKLILISLAAIAALAPAQATAMPQPKAYTVLLAGGAEDSMIQIWLSTDGREYVIDSLVQLEVGGDICSHPEGIPNELVCQASRIGGFEVNVGPGKDRVTVAKNVSVPVTMRGGSGNDVLLGGGGPDELIGGPGDDRLFGWRGADVFFGGSGEDVILAGPGSDTLNGGPGQDTLGGGPGKNVIRRP
jgi:hypothetical protein